MSYIQDCLALAGASHGSNGSKRAPSWSRVLRVLAIGTALFSIGFVTAFAGTPAGYAEYLVPFDEDVFVYVTDPLVNVSPIPGNYTTHSLISLTAWSDNVTVYWDHWENGYGYDPNNPDGPGSDEKYILDTGETLNFESAAIPRPRTGTDGNTYVGAAGNCNAQPAPGAFAFRNTTNLCFDGRDRIFTVGGATTVTRGGFINSPNPPPELGVRAAVGEEVYPLSPQLVKYVLPFGEDGGRVDYQRLAVTIQATVDNTVLQLDLNGDGAYDGFNPANGYRTARTTCAPGCLVSTVILNRGQTYILDRDSDGTLGGTLNKDTVILGSDTLQVEYFYGEEDGAIYDTRAVSAYPRGFWGTEYYAPVDGAAVADTDILLYNPNAGAITINWETAVATGSFTLASKERGFFQAKGAGYVPDGSGVYLRGTAPFWGISDADTNTGNWDWGYALVPSYLLTDDQAVSWAPGNVPLMACNAAEGRDGGLFVTASQDNTTFFIDKDGDGVADTDASIEVLRGSTVVAATGSGYRANRLQSLYITGSNVGNTAGSICDLTGAHIWATGPFAMAYGENPDKADATGGADLGYTVLPSPENWMDLALTVDKGTSPVLVSTAAGATVVTYTLVVNSHEFNIDAVSVEDTLPANWTYDNNSTTITLPNLTQISGAAANPAIALPSLTWGTGLLGSLLPNQRITITFNARTTAAFASGALSRNQVEVEGTRNVGGVTQTFNARDFVFNSYVSSALNMQLTKASSVPVTTPVSPGDTLTYTVTATNPAGTTTTLTGLSLNDTLPPGVTSVAGTMALNRSSVADAFGANAYTNSNGTRAWATNWTETVEATNATGGDIQVVGGELRLNNDASNEPTVLRRANLAGATSAILSFRYRTGAGVDAADSVRICGRRQNGDAWTCPLAGGNFTGVTGASSGSYSVNLATLGVLTATAEISFQFLADTYTDTVGNNESFFVDDLSITYDLAVTLAAGNPPEILSNAALYSLATNQSLVATFNVTVNNPFPNGVSEIVNLATGSVTEIPLPLSATARNIVLVPSGGTGTVGDRVWLDADADGVFDPGETGLPSVEVTLKDQFSTPVQVTTTDSQGRYTFVDVTPGTGYYVEITGGMPAGATNTFADFFNTNGVFTGNNGTLNWLTNWLEVNDDLIATSGDIQIANNRLEFRDTTDGGTVVTGESIQRSATATGATSLELRYSWDSVLLETNGSDNIIVESSPDGTTWTTVRTLNGDVSGTYTDTIPWIPTNNTAFVRFRAEDPIEAGEQARIDNVVLSKVTGSGLAQTTDTAGDTFPTSGLFTGNTGTRDWLTPWVEAGDGANTANAGSVQVANNRIEFGAVTAGTESILRSVMVAGATSVELQYAWSQTNLLGDGTDNVVVEYSLNGTTWLVVPGVSTLNGGVAAGTITNTIPWVPTNNSFFVRFRAEDALGATKLATIDNVQVRFVQNLRTQSFNLVAGQDFTQADLGFRATPGTASIGDIVWVDANNDQTRNPGEPGLAGITVNLYQDTDGDGLANGGPIASTVTGPGGAYLFTAIPANGALDYVVSLNTGQAPLTGYAATTYTLFSYPDLPSGAVRIDADFGFQNPGGTRSIADGVWLDSGLPTGTANNGLKDGTEVGIAGVTVDLLNSAGFTIASTTTAANGAFQFTGVPTGQNYRWRITDTAGVLDDFYGTSASALSGTYQMAGLPPSNLLTANLDYTVTPHFGYNQTRSIGDTIWNDLDASITQNGSEPGIGGVTVLLYRDVNGNSTFEPGGADGAIYATQVTDAFGHYLFAGLPSGSQWFVSIDDTQPVLSGFTVLTTPDNSGVAGHQRLVPTLSGVNNNLGMDYGYRTNAAFALSGRLFSDVNRNGVDNTEAGLENVTLDLVNSTGVVIGTTTTVANGAYSFAGLPAGTYTVRVTDTNGVLPGAETTFERTEGGLAGSYNGQETVTLGPNVTNVTFGFYRTNVQVTQVVISSFLARDIQGSLALEWTTASEIGTVGFYLKRWDERRNRYVSVNERLIPSLIGSTAGGTYRFVDREAAPGVPYRYVIVEVEASGKRLRYGPYEVDTRTSAVRTEGDDDDEETGNAELKRAAADTLLLERGEWKAPRRGNLKKRLERWNAARAERGQAAKRRRSTAAAKIGVSENALYFVTLQELQTAAGMPASALWTRTYSLTNRGEAVALAPSADGDGFWFYGQTTTSNVERDNVYRLSETTGGARMGSRKNPRVNDPTGNEVFPKTLHVERDVMAVNNVYKDPDGDFYIWDYVFAGAGANSFNFRTDGAARTGRASVTVRLKGGSDTDALTDHHAAFRLNGTLIGEAVWDGLNELVTTVDFDATLLENGENTLAIEGLLDTGADYSLFYVDSFDVRYASRYRASGNRAEVQAAGNTSVLISGFTRPDITLFDITTPNHPVFVQAPVIRTADGTYGVVAASKDPRAAYYALTPDGLVAASRLLPDTSSSLANASNRAEYVVITTEALKDTAQTLADYRSDLSSMVVDIEDIYDEFNDGNASPYALKAFLTHARTKWRTPPRYVVLAGEGTYDYKDVEGFGDNLIPTMMANTPDGLFPADTWFVERAGAAAVEIAIGRLPVSTTIELAEVIRKIEVRETALERGAPWLRNTLLVADNADDGGDFVQSSETVASLLSRGTPLFRAYISAGGGAEARANLIGALDGGVGLVNYFGHSGFDYVADELLLKTEDVSALQNRDRPSMLFALTCVVGNSALPGYSTLGEELLRQEGGGLAALYAPTGMSANDLATPLAQGLHTALQAQGTRRIGDAVNGARQSYKRGNLPLFMLQIYNLLGDPAMRVR